MTRHDRSVRRPFGPPRSSRPRERGFTLIELLVSMTVMLLVIGSVFTLLDPSQATSRTQPEAADVLQRLRISADSLEKDLLMAGAGTYSGAIAGTLANYFPPILPYRTGILPDPGLSYFEDRISIVYVPDTASQTTVWDSMPQTSSEIKVHAQPGCPDVKPPDNLCGFKEGMRVLIFDDTGAYDFFTITQVQSTGTEGHLQHNTTMNASKELSKKYNELPDHAKIAQVATVVYWLDPATRQLMLYDGTDPFNAIPLVDNVAGLRFRYYGDPNPPLDPHIPGTANCIVDAAGSPLLPVLPSNGSSLVELPGTMLTDGPVCGSGATAFDADLFRVRKVSVQVRTQAAAPEMRGVNPTGGGQVLFQNPGTSNSPYRRVPDAVVEFDVTPRNLNLVR